MTQFLNKYSKWVVPAMFVMVLLVNYLSSAGIIFPNTQAEISNKYTNLFAPAGFTFSIWGVIYLGVIVSLSIGFTESAKSQLGRDYRQLIQPQYIEWMLFNILWIVTWSYDLLLPALLAILLYTRSITRVMKTISATPSLRQSPWRLKYPVGLHAGWLYPASLANLTTYVVSIGFDGTGTVAVWWTIVMMLVALLVVSYLYVKYGNEFIMIPTLWALIGILAKHRPGSSFEFANTWVFVAAIILLMIGIGLFVHFLRLQRQQEQKFRV